MNHIKHEEITQEDVDLYFFYRRNGIQEGFFLRYFAHLKQARTTVEAFKGANDEFFSLFGELRYNSIASFRNQLRKYLNG